MISISYYFNKSHLYHTDYIIIEDPPPPPLQIPAIPNFPLFVFKTLINDKIILAPDIPKGCPNATAPPCTLT